jgi:hypothetical protein
MGIRMAPRFRSNQVKHDTERQTILTCPDLFATENGPGTWSWPGKYGRRRNMVDCAVG